jgi:LmbE family N-acetylglucosaminyl deacetylase
MQKILILFCLFIGIASLAQKPKQWTSSEIFQNLQKLKVQARVLYLAAHPDDENTRFIAYCANEKLTTTAYMSLTRGDGGQNLIGPELREELGLIRTQELIMARSVDGGQQFFSRANDFGYSKNPEETFQIWDREKVLGDLVYVIRAFQPDIIVCRFPTDGRGGHGHHTASAILGEEAFDLAADANAYPEQLKTVKIWQPTRLVTNTGRWWNDSISGDDPNVVVENIGAYSAMLGTSCNEIAALSRTMHKSQGFGSTGVRGEQLEYFEHVKGKKAGKSLFDDVDFSWNRIEGAKGIEKEIDKILKKFDVHAPEKSITPLFKLRNKLNKLPKDVRIDQKITEIEKLILQCGGVYLEAVVDKYSAAQNDSIEVNLELVSRQSSSFTLADFNSSNLNWNSKTREYLKLNKVFSYKQKLQIPSSMAISDPYWLKKKGTLGTYNLANQELVLHPDNGPASFIVVELNHDFERLIVKVPLVYKENDPVKGEVYKPFYVQPPVSIRVEQENILAKVGDKQLVKVHVKNYTDRFSGTWNLEIPKGWTVKEFDKNIELTTKNEEKTIVFELIPGPNASSGIFNPILIKDDGTRQDKEVKFITYDHIPTQMYLKSSEVNINLADIQRKGQKVAYFEGAGDAIPEALRLVGYTVDVLTETDLSRINEYDAVVLGIRALNTKDEMVNILPKLFEYVKQGGNLIVQYNTSHALVTKEIAPFDLKLSRDRVTDETAEMRILVPNHPVLNTPNKITEVDFENWVQERGLYFPNEWAPQFTPIFACNDEGETSKEGSLLIAPYGKGNYIYTGLSFFRELPVGVPGAYRLLVNLISLGHE